jgi:hypothetical protein
MKKTFILGLIVVAILLTGCWPPQKEGQPVGEGTSTQKSAESKQSGGQGEAEEESYSGSLTKMMGMGVPLKCSWKQDESYYGESWVKGKKSYGEITQEGKTAKVIFKDDCMWSWEEGNPQGFKMCVEPTEVEAPPGGGEGEVDLSKMQGGQPTDIDYQCKPALIGEDKFEPPAEVNFMSMEEMMQGINN